MLRRFVLFESIISFAIVSIPPTGTSDEDKKIVAKSSALDLGSTNRRESS